MVCNSNLALLRQKFGKNSSSLEYYRRPRFIIAGVLSETQIHHHWSTIGDPDSSSLEYYRRPRFIIGVPYSPSKAPIHSLRHLFIIRPPYTSSETFIGHRRPTQFYRIPFEFHWRTSFITGALSNFIGDHVCPIGVEPLIIIGDIIYKYIFIGIRKKMWGPRWKVSWSITKGEWGCMVFISTITPNKLFINKLARKTLYKYEH